MSAFSFNFGLSYAEFYSHIADVECNYSEGWFEFDRQGIEVGNSLQNNNGGIGGFVGPNHEYFLYCGWKYAEIAIARFNKNTKK